MASERIDETRPEHRATTNSDGEAPWADLEVTVPTDRDHASIVALVECALVELTHEAVGAVFVSRQVGRSTRTPYVAVDDVGEQFQKRHFDDRLGWHETTVPRRTVRDELITQLTRSASSPAERPHEAAVSEPDTFAVKPVRELQTPYCSFLTNTSDQPHLMLGNTILTGFLRWTPTRRPVPRVEVP